MKPLICIAALLTLARVALPAKEDWNVPHAPFHIVGNVYFVGTKGLGSFLISTPNGLILLDGALPASAPLIEKNVATLGFKIKDVRYLLNSHAHYDHCGGLAALKRDSGAQLVISKEDAPVLEAGRHGSYGAAWGGTFPAAHVDRIVSDGDTVELGGVKLTALLTPGHTKGCTTWTMQTSEGGQTRNVIFYCSTSVPGYSLVQNAQYPNIVSDYQQSFARLKKVKADVFLAGHTEFFDMDGKLAKVKPGAPNPFVDPTELPHFVAQSEAEFTQTLAEQTKRASLH